MKNFYKNKRILITGGTGMIGFQLVKLLSQFNTKISVASLEKNPHMPKNTKFYRVDLRDYSNCLKITKKIDLVFHLAGIKGSPKLTKKKPYSFMTPMLQFNTNMLEAAKKNKIKRFMYTSSIGVYHPNKIMKEEDVWKTFPSYNDWYSGWAKRIGELQLDALSKEYPSKMKTVVVRPANVYGPYDNFDPETSMVIPSLISKFFKSKNNKVDVWGDGSPVRDFIYSEDVANAMIALMYSSPQYPVNIGSGTGVKIKKVVEIINNYFNNSFKIVWDTSKPSGDKKRLLEIKKLNKFKKFKSTDLKKGIFKTIEWYKNNKKTKFNRYNAFK